MCRHEPFFDIALFPLKKRCERKTEQKIENESIIYLNVTSCSHRFQVCSTAQTADRQISINIRTSNAFFAMKVKATTTDLKKKKRKTSFVREMINSVRQIQYKWMLTRRTDASQISRCNCQPYSSVNKSQLWWMMMRYVLGENNHLIEQSHALTQSTFLKNYPSKVEMNLI